MTDMKKILPLAAALCVIAGSCAKESTINTGVKAQQYLGMFMEKYYPLVKADENGLYILEDIEGDGDPWVQDSAFVYASYTLRTLDGAISSSTEDAIARQLGTFKESNYYGPRYMAQGKGSSFAGLDALFDGMKAGGYRKAVIPAWMLNTSRFDTQQQYINACSTETHMIYDVRFYGQTNDIQRTEIDSLERYVLRKFNADRKESSSYTDDTTEGTFYFFSDTTEFAGGRHFPQDTTLKINYTGYLLNGQVFDTTDEITAKDARIYVRGKTYEPVSVTFSPTVANIKMGSSSPISGFQGGLSKMVFLGQKATFLFTSSLGYTGSGSGSSIPPYSPLVFEVEIVK